jgi:hypothetical protein
MEGRALALSAPKASLVMFSAANCDITVTRKLFLLLKLTILTQWAC